jgi:hypothetical protein
MAKHKNQTAKKDYFGILFQEFTIHFEKTSR